MVRATAGGVRPSNSRRAARDFGRLFLWCRAKNNLGECPVLGGMSFCFIPRQLDPVALTSRQACDLLPSLQPKLACLPAGQCGGPKTGMEFRTGRTAAANR